MKELLQYGVPLLCAVIAFLGVRQSRENRRLRKRLRIALYDCLAFYELEEFLCESIRAEARSRPLPTVLGLKRAFRALLRHRGIETPSDRATPHQIKMELAKL